MGRRHDTFVDASPRDPCPVCGHGSWCTRARDGRTVICRRESAWDGRPGRAGTDQQGHRWTWYLPEVDAQAHAPAPIRHAPVAPIETRDRVYRGLLDRLRLDYTHRDDLRRRGLSTAAIAAGGYRTLPLQGRARVARELVERFGADDCSAIPGLYQRDAETPYWTIAGHPGLLIPVRDVHERITGMQVRLDAPDAGGRYRWLTSQHRDGPGAEIACHVPLHGSGEHPRVRVTEGPLKGDVATALDPDRILTIAVPGVSSWHLALPVLEALGARVVHVALDADCRTNPHVALALVDLVRALSARRYGVALEEWPDTHKGIDDLLAAGGRPTVTGEESCAA